MIDMPKTNRRQFLAGAGLLGLAGAAGIASKIDFANAQNLSPEIAEIELVSVRDPQHSAQLAIAHELGYFAEEGVTVRPNYTINGPDLPNLAASGQVQLLISGLDAAALLREKGLDFKWLMKVSEISDTQGVVVRESAGIGQPSDLIGKRIGMSAGAAVELGIRNMCADYGVDFNALTFVNVDPPEQAIALSRGELDAMACWEPYVSSAAANGGRLYFTGRNSYIDDPQNPKSVNWLYLAIGLISTPKFMTDAPNTLRAVMRALLRASDLIAQDVNTAVPAVARHLGVPEEGLAAILGRNDYSPLVDDRLTTGYPKFQDWAVEKHYLEKGAPVPELVDMSVMRELRPDMVQI